MGVMTSKLAWYQKDVSFACRGRGTGIQLRVLWVFRIFRCKKSTKFDAQTCCLMDGHFRISTNVIFPFKKSSTRNHLLESARFVQLGLVGKVVLTVLNGDWAKREIQLEDFKSDTNSSKVNPLEPREKNTSFFPLHWLVNMDPFNGVLSVL